MAAAARAEQHRQQPQGADAGAAQATMPYNQVQETAAAVDEGFALTEA